MNNLLQKCDPSSEVTAIGVPNRDKRLRRMKLNTTLASKVVVGIASSHFEA